MRGADEFFVAEVVRPRWRRIAAPEVLRLRETSSRYHFAWRNIHERNQTRAAGHVEIARRYAGYADRSNLHRHSEGRILAALKTCFDPELSVNIYELGLIYELDVERSARRPHLDDVDVAGLPGRRYSRPGRALQSGRRAGRDVGRGGIGLEPPWDRSRMSESAQLELGFL